LRQAERYCDAFVGPLGQEYVCRLFSEIEREQAELQPADQAEAIQKLRDYEVGFEDGVASGRRTAYEFKPQPAERYLVSMIIPEGCAVVVDGQMLYMIDPRWQEGRGAK